MISYYSWSPCVILLLIFITFIFHNWNDKKSVYCTSTRPDHRSNDNVQNQQAHWHVGSLSKCIRNIDNMNERHQHNRMSRYENGELTLNSCGTGFQYRTVYCVDSNKVRISAAACYFTKQVTPRQAIPCHIPCDDDCIVSEWTLWTPCIYTLTNSNAIHLSPRGTKYRYRTILAYNGPHGFPCPQDFHLSQNTSCTKNTKPFYQPPAHDAFLAKSLPVRFTTKEDHTHLNYIPLKIRPNDPSKFIYKRPINTNSIEDNSLFSSINFDHYELHPYDQWSDCAAQDLTRMDIRINKLPSTYNSLIRRITQVYSPLKYSPQNLPNCMGTRYKPLACYDIVSGKYVHSYYCKGRDRFRESCYTLDCTRDCQMSEWSSWSSCTSDDCSLGLAYRDRVVKSQSMDGGRPCSHDIQQKMPCFGECRIYQEIPIKRQCLKNYSTTDDYVKMQNLEEFSCGKGYVVEIKKCLEFKNDGTYEVDIHHCNSLLNGTLRWDYEYTECHLNCPYDCVASEWTPWTQCLQPCHRNIRQRYRTIIRQPKKKFWQCPHLHEWEACVKGKNCFKYKLIKSAWSSCISDIPIANDTLTKSSISSPLVLKSRRFRYIFCINPSNRQRVLLKKCNYDKGHIYHVDHEVCPQEHIRDCRVSSWSQWNDHNCKCINDTRLIRQGFKMTRHRKIIHKQNHLGRNCPILSMSAPCPYKNCLL